MRGKSMPARDTSDALLLCDRASLPDAVTPGRQDRHTSCVLHRSGILGDKRLASLPDEYSCWQLFLGCGSPLSCHCRSIPLLVLPFPRLWLDSHSRHLLPPASVSADTGAGP